MTTSSSDLIPKAQLSAYQRWELVSLQQDDLLARSRQPEDGHLSMAAQAEREMEALRTRAHDEAYAAGYAEGVVAAANAKAKLDTLLVTLADHVGDHEQQLCDEVLDFALLLGRQLVGEALAVRRELVLPVVSAALRQLPQASQRLQLMLNPADLELVKTFLAREQVPPGIELVADPAIAPGGCAIETEQCEIDATVPSRWRRLLANLGRSEDWLEPA